ncbi:hypothetical protein RJ639_047787, partial [Escallonia herrerae]
REAGMIVKTMINEVIAEKLDIDKLSSTSNTFHIAYLGCSVAPTQAVESKYKSIRLASETPEFQVFLNDHATNDFNTLFTSLPSKKSYFVAVVPGSFYGRLFPESSLHILSKVPEEVLDINSPAWNKEKIYYTSASDEVFNAYAVQYANDMNNFLNAKAEEVVAGRLVLLVMISIPDGVHRSQSESGMIYNALGLCLMDLAREVSLKNILRYLLDILDALAVTSSILHGLISESQVDALNLPVYTTSPKGLIQGNGHFSIEKMKLTDPSTRIDEPVDMQRCTTHIRAAVEGVLVKHFGCSEKMDGNFGRYNQKAAKYSVMDASYKKGTLLFVVLKRK